VTGLVEVACFESKAETGCKEEESTQVVVVLARHPKAEALLRQATKRKKARRSKIRANQLVF
jgi:hypothetical protein